LRLALQYPETAPDDLPRRDIEKHIRQMMRDLAPITMYNSTNDLRVWFKFVAAEVGSDNPMLEIPAQKMPDLPDPPVLKLDQIQAILNACKGDKILDRRDLAVILLFFESGIRRAELENLRLSDVNLRDGTAFIRKGKGGKPRTATFGQETATAIRRYLKASQVLRARHWGDGDSPLFLSRFGTKLEYTGIAVLMKTRGDAAGVPGLRCHLWRHAWAHYNLNSGVVGELNVQTLGGWTSSRMLARYGRALRSERAVAAGRAHPVGELLRKR
jgi:integrase